MTLNEYQRLAQRTSPDGHDRILNGCLGLIGESGEIVDIIKKHMFQSTPDTPLPTDKLIDEMGDVMWYIAETVTGMGHKLGDMLSLYGKLFFSDETKLHDLAAVLSADASSIYIYLYAYEDHDTALSKIIHAYNLLCGMCYKLGCTPEYMMGGNIEKLRKRYPDGFDPERSMNRPEYQREEETEPASGILFNERNRTV